jgi:hypothetical protein
MAARPGRRTNSASAKRGRTNFEHVLFYCTSKGASRENDEAEKKAIKVWDDGAFMVGAKHAARSNTLRYPEPQPIERSHRCKAWRVAHLECRGLTLVLRMRERFESHAARANFVHKNGKLDRNLHSVGGFAHGSSYRRRFQIRQEGRQQTYGRQH